MLRDKSQCRLILCQILFEQLLAQADKLPPASPMFKDRLKTTKFSMTVSVSISRSLVLYIADGAKTYVLASILTPKSPY